MTMIAGMAGGSGDGTAASRKAGWLPFTPPRPSVAGPGRSTTRDALANLAAATVSAALDRLAQQPAPTNVRQRPSARAGDRPLPPDGSPPPRKRHTEAAPTVQPLPAPTAARLVAPPGHACSTEPIAAPQGEFRFLLRCSCGRERIVVVTRAMLASAAADSRSPADAIVRAEQAALDALHRA